VTAADWAYVIYGAAFGVDILWYYACPRGLFRHGPPWLARAAPAIRGELGPFILPAILIGYGAMVARGHLTGAVEGFDWVAACLLAIMLFNWWTCRKHGDDNRWRRRRRKATDRVRAAASRLIVEPGGA
jgi:hypothetical protein